MVYTPASNGLRVAARVSAFLCRLLLLSGTMLMQADTSGVRFTTTGFAPCRVPAADAFVAANPVFCSASHGSGAMLKVMPWLLLLPCDGASSSLLLLHDTVAVMPASSRSMAVRVCLICPGDVYFMLLFAFWCCFAWYTMLFGVIYGVVSWCTGSVMPAACYQLLPLNSSPPTPMLPVFLFSSFQSSFVASLLLPACVPVGRTLVVSGAERFTRMQRHTGVVYVFLFINGNDDNKSIFNNSLFPVVSYQPHLCAVKKYGCKGIHF